MSESTCTELSAVGERLCEPTDAETAASTCCPTVALELVTLGIADEVLLLPTSVCCGCWPLLVDVAAVVVVDVDEVKTGPAEVFTMAGSWMSDGGSWLGLLCAG